jgi:hypothetical protein
MDPGFYEDLAGWLIGRDGRLNRDDASTIQRFIDSRHCGLALEEITRTLAHYAIGITDQERADMLALTGQVDMLARSNLTPLTDDLVRAAIRACPPRPLESR